MSIYVATTEGITVTAHPTYIDGQSDILRKKFVFGYFIRIANNTDEPVRLMRRHWFISDSNGDVKQVEGEGVVGKQPVIPPGEAHVYNSFSILQTFEGAMEGTYLMRRESGEEFRVVIPRFVLRAAAN